MSSFTVETVSIQHCDFEAKVKVGGTGSPLVFLHAAAGPRWDGFLDALAENHTVYAPDHPGTGDTDRASIHQVDSLWDLMLIYEELFDALELDQVPLVGISYGGMVASEIAAQLRGRISRLALVSPLGLWRDDAPVRQYMLDAPEDLMSTLFVNPGSREVLEYMTMPEDPKEAAVVTADMIWALGSTGKFVWPIPDKGLKKRLHRVTADSLVIWGEEDALISSVYAEEFKSRIKSCRVEKIPGAGHSPQVENLDTLVPLVLDFLAEGKQASERPRVATG